MSVVLALLASLTYGAADFLGGMVGRRVPILAVMLWSQAVGLILAVVASSLIPAAGVAPQDLLWGAGGGLAGAVGLFLFYKGLAEGRMAVVSPVASVVGALVPMTIGLALGERPTAEDWAGITLAMPAIWLISARPGDGTGSKGDARYGIWAGVGFGLFFVAMAQTAPGSGIWPLAGARLTVVAVLAIAATVRRLAIPPLGSRLALAVVGLGDVLGNVLLLLALRSGLLSIVSVLASLYPAVTVILAVSILGEGVERRQVGGLALAMAAVGLIVV